jgi:hypothetical protein
MKGMMIAHNVKAPKTKHWTLNLIGAPLMMMALSMP